ncbi:MAG: penicillin-binding protein [Frankiales bacterium]|nr:penicillin-binding protein [Frankiales bacterium]
MIAARKLAPVLSLLAVLLLTTACTSSHKTPAEQVAAQSFLDAVGRGDATAAAATTTASTKALATIEASLTGLGSGTVGTLLVTSLTGRTSSAATADFHASWRLPGVTTPWSYDGSLPMTKQGKQWLVSWAATDLHPDLADGAHLVVQRTLPSRAALQDSAGRPLFTETPVVDVGIEPSAVTNLTSLAATLAAVPQLESTAAQIISAVKATPPNGFALIITLRKPVYESIRARIHELAGTRFPERTLLLPPTSQFARPLLGSVGPATKDIIDASKGRVQTGDDTGLSGLQLAFDSTLAGSAAVDVYAANDSDGSLGAKLGSVMAAKPGTAVRLTLDRTVQQAADAALAGETQPASLVALQPSTGKILAVANSAAATDDIALVGQYPAGSTFKIVTYTAAFTAKPALTPATPVTCPGAVEVNGQTFVNENQFHHEGIDLSAAFGYSCNTTAINLALGLPATAQRTAATALGLGATWKLPVAAFSGSLPAPGRRSTNERRTP